MTFSTVDTQHVRVTAVVVSDDLLTVELSDGRTISAPLSWYPRLCHGSHDERADWRLIGGGRGIHWPQLDEDISAENLILGKPSAESQESLNQWLRLRKPKIFTKVKNDQEPAIKYTPTGEVHRGTKGGRTGCGVDTKANPTHWENTFESITCAKNGCKN